MKRTLLIISIPLIFISCSVSEYIYHNPPAMQDEITVASASEVGMDSVKFTQLITKIKDKEFISVHSVLVSRYNKLVLEEYFDGYDVNKSHDLYSAGKSITSALFGLAFDRNMISPDEKLLKFFEPYYPFVKNENKAKHDIKLSHLMTMSSGIKCGTFGDPKTDLSRLMLKSMDPVKTFLDAEMEAEPGTVFKYNDSMAQIIFYTIALAVKMNYYTFEDSLFYSPLGIDIKKTEPGLRPRDFLKIGLLYLNKGVWNGKRILSGEWIEESTSFKIKPASSPWFAYGYGYFWWLNRFNYKGKEVECIMAVGNGHQALYIIPELQLVVVFTGGNFKNGVSWQQPHKMLQEYVIDAIY